jgi:predicted DNA-binding transcriptional regulator AlpA
LALSAAGNDEGFDALPDLLTVNEVAQLIGQSERTIWSWTATAGFPKPLDKPRRPRLWRAAEITSWLASVMKPSGKLTNDHTSNAT